MASSNKKSILISILTVLVLITAMFLMACDDKKTKNETAQVPKDEVIKISNLGEFLAISGSEGTTYELVNDIDCGGAVLTPIGSESKPFVGKIDGKGYEISNFVIDGSSIQTNAITGEYYTGVFGVVGNAQIKNINFSNFSIDFTDNETITNVLNFGLIAETQENATVALSDVSIADIQLNQHFDKR